MEDNPRSIPGPGRLAILMLVAASLALGLVGRAAGATCDRLPADLQNPSYGWPVKPFHAQHPVRGYFGDPRIGLTKDGGTTRSIHTGIDVSAPDGTAVYATITGRVQAVKERVVVIVGDNGVEFSYWHVMPVVRPGQRTIAYRTLVGTIAAGKEHVHFAERRGGRYVNPLRPGALGPYADDTCPELQSLSFERLGQPFPPESVHGIVDVVLTALDRPSMSAPPPWENYPVSPALIEWRLLADGKVVRPWQAAFDVRGALLANDYRATYASGTRQNRPNNPGAYRFYLARRWDVGQLEEGEYELQTTATDTRGNRSELSTTFVVSDRAHPQR